MAGYLTTGFSTLEYLTLDIYTLDADGIVLNSELILNFGYRRYLDNLGEMTFDNQLELPADTAAIAFGYIGRVIEGGGGSRVTRKADQIDWNFWKVPGREPSEWNVIAWCHGALDDFQDGFDGFNGFFARKAVLFYHSVDNVRFGERIGHGGASFHEEGLG